MIRKYVFTMVMTGVFLVAGVGTALSNWDEKPASDMSSNESMSPSDAGSSYTEGPSETGSLPKGEDLSNAQTGITEGFTLREYGGVIFREEVDSH